MRTRFGIVLAVLLCVSDLSAQELKPQPMEVPPAPYVYTSGKVEGNSLLLFTVLFFAVGWVLVLLFGGVAILVGIPMRIWAKLRRTNDPRKLALSDPYLSAKLEQMTDEEWATFLAEFKS